MLRIFHNTKYEFVKHWRLAAILTIAFIVAGIAAVMATMRWSLWASLTNASANAWVYPVGTAFGGPFTGSNIGASCKCFSSSSSAGE